MGDEVSRIWGGMWAGMDCYVVGGGPSLQSFWRSKAHEQLLSHPRVIVINRAFKDVPTAAVWFSEDLHVITDVWGRTPEFQAFPGVKVFHALDPTYIPQARKVDSTLHIVERQIPGRGKFWSRGLDQGLSWSTSSMVGAINLADIFGAAKMYLLGLDCSPTPTGELENYHEDYEGSLIPRARAFQYIDFISDFKHWVKPHVEHIEVINCNPASGVDAWPRKEYDWKEGLPSERAGDRVLHDRSV